jgi:hypothetical protein
LKSKRNTVTTYYYQYRNYYADTQYYYAMGQTEESVIENKFIFCKRIEIAPSWGFFNYEFNK